MSAFLQDPRLKVRRLGPEAGFFVDADLSNLNTPEEFEDFLERLRKGSA